MLAVLTRPETAPLIGLLRAANRDVARLTGSHITTIDTWRGVPLEELSEEELLKAVAKLRSAAETIRARRAAA